MKSKIIKVIIFDSKGWVNFKRAKRIPCRINSKNKVVFEKLVPNRKKLTFCMVFLLGKATKSFIYKEYTAFEIRSKDIFSLANFDKYMNKRDCSRIENWENIPRKDVVCKRCDRRATFNRTSVCTYGYFFKMMAQDCKYKLEHVVNG